MHILYLILDNNREHKKEYYEFINFAIQGLNKNAQFSLAIAVTSINLIFRFRLATIRHLFLSLSECFMHIPDKRTDHNKC